MGVFCIGQIASHCASHAAPPKGIEYMNVSWVRLGHEASRYKMAFLFISSFETLANLPVSRSLASKFCCSMISQLAVVPTHTSVQKKKIGMSKGRSSAG
jgi:hypothetical protein